MIQNTILDTEYATVWYYPEPKIVHHVFHKFIYGPEFRNVLETGLDAFKKHGAQKWLSDDRKNVEFTPDDIVFSVTDWGPRAAKAGWKFWALVVPDDVAARGGMQDIIGTFYDLGVRVALFTNLEDARNWLVKL